jgi:hypothetical protein
MWLPRRLATLKASTACTGIALPLPYISVYALLLFSLHVEFKAETIAEIWKRDVTCVSLIDKVSQEQMDAFSLSRINSQLNSSSKRIR